jgi:transposase
LDAYSDCRASAILARAQRRGVRPNIWASLRSESGLPAFTLSRYAATAAGLAEFRAALPGWGGQRISGRVCRAVFAALADTEGAVAWCRRGLFRRVADELGDLQRIRGQLRTVEADMVSVLGELGLSWLADIPGLTAVGAAAILAETGDPRRYDGSSSLVKRAEPG